MILRALIFVLALSAAGGAAWLTTQTGPVGATAPAVEIRTETAPTVDVLVAAADIPGGELLSADKLRWEPWPESNVSDPFITRAEQADAAEKLAGKFVETGFAEGEPIREARLTAVSDNLMSAKLEPGKRAAAVRVSAESAAGGFILPGDRVDVIQTVTAADDGAPRNTSRIIISNVRVLAIDQTASQTADGTAVGKTATLELSPEQAERIMAAEASGMLSLTLRSVADHSDQTAFSAEAVQTVVVRRGADSAIVTVR